MKERTKGRSVSAAAMRAGMHRHTAARYRELGHGPVTAALLAPKRGRRRPDPLKPLWPLAEPFLAETPELEAKALFEHLLARLPEADAPELLLAFAEHRIVAQWSDLPELIVPLREQRKANRLPHEAALRLIRPPSAPKPRPVAGSL